MSVCLTLALFIGHEKCNLGSEEMLFNFQWILSLFKIRERKIIKKTGNNYLIFVFVTLLHLHTWKRVNWRLLLLLPRKSRVKEVLSLLNEIYRHELHFTTSINIACGSLLPMTETFCLIWLCKKLLCCAMSANKNS